VRIDEELMEIWPNEVCDTKRRLQQKGKDVRVEYDLINDLGFNLCVALWSLVVMLVAYFGVEGM